MSTSKEKIWHRHDCDVGSHWLLFCWFAAFTTTAESVQETFWALVPPIVAIALALVTKEVYSSLFIGVLTGGFCIPAQL